MKKLLLPTIVIGLAACGPQTPTVDYTLFSGTISNSSAEKVHLVNDEMEYAIDLKDGAFADTLRLEEGYYNLYVGRERTDVYLAKGGDLTVTLDANRFDSSLTYTGSLAPENQTLADIVLIKAHHSGDMRAFFSKDEDEFIEALNQQGEALKKKLQNDKLSSDFSALQIRNTDYIVQNAYMNYEKFHAYFSQQADFKASDDFNAGKKEFSLDLEEEYKNSEEYRNYINNTLSREIDVIYDESKGYSKTIMEAVGKFSNPYIKESLLKTYSSSLLSPNEDLKAAYDFLLANTNNEEFKTEYSESYDKLKKLAKGMPSPQFTNYENHKGGTTSLSDLKGKYAYIDVWATWCGPCIREIPSLKSVEADYHDKNIEFVSASIDREEDHDTWIDMVTNKDLKGVQLMADNDWKSQFVQDYQIKGIPRFILIDPNGNIVSADAPRPSDPKLRELLTELNI